MSYSQGDTTKKTMGNLFSRFNQMRTGDFSPAAAAFSQVAGVLGGFCTTIIVFVLSPNIIGEPENKDLVVALILVAGTLYILSAGILANVISFKPGRVQISGFNFGIFLFHFGNIFLGVGLIALVSSFKLNLARTVSLAILGIIILYAFINVLVPIILFVMTLLMRVLLYIIGGFFLLFSTTPARVELFAEIQEENTLNNDKELAE